MAQEPETKLGVRDVVIDGAKVLHVHLAEADLFALHAGGTPIAVTTNVRAVLTSVAGVFLGFRVSSAV